MTSTPKSPHKLGAAQSTAKAAQAVREGGQLAMYECRPALYSGKGYEVREADRREVDWMIRSHYLRCWPGVVVATLGLYRNG